MHLNATNHAIVATMIRMSKQLGFEVVAEGVECLEELEILRSEGCDQIQGFYYSSALSFADFVAYANLIEEKRQRNSAELAKYFATLKENAATFILQTETLANLIDDKIDNETKLEELRNINAALENQKAELEKALKADEATELAAERKSAQACLNTKVSSFAIQVCEHNKQTLIEHRDILKEQLGAGIALTDEDSKLFEEKFKNLADAIAEFHKLNVKIPALTVEKGKSVAPESLTPYYFK